MKVIELERNADGKLPAFAWPGGYPIYYLDRDCSVLCADCATKSLDDVDELDSFRPTDADVYYEGPTMQCENCNADIQSAYGDPNETEEVEGE